MRELSEAGRQEWMQFARATNRGMLHHNDRERFRRFIIGLHSRDEEFKDADLNELLTAEPACSEEMRKQLVVAFNVGKDILTDYDRVRG